MRYFNENLEYIGNSFDEDTKIVKEKKINKFFFEYVIEQKEKKHYEDDKKTGKRNWIVDNPEIASWVYNGTYSGEGIPEPPINYPKNLTFPIDENGEQDFIREEISIVRDLTEEEIEEREREKQRKEEEREKENERQEELKNFIETSSSSIRLDTRIPNHKVKDNATHTPPFVEVDNYQAKCNKPNLSDPDLDFAIVNKIYLDGRLENLKQEIIEELRN